MSVIYNTESDKTIHSILADGTNVNVGKHAGVIARIESELDRPLQWLICLLHFSGEIESQLHGEVYKYPIVKFITVPGRVAPISQAILKDLSTDQLYLYEACLAIQGGPELSDMNFVSNRICPLNHSRWLTANRALRLYMSSREPSINLTRIVNYVLNIYAPMWFRVKSNPYCTDESHDLFYVLFHSNTISFSNSEKWILCSF